MTAEKTITFADTGIGNVEENKERLPLKAGMIVAIKRIEIRKSHKYGDYSVFDVAGDDGDVEMYFSMSQVITSQAKEILEKYGDTDGILKTPVLAAVTNVKSAGGRFYLSFQ